MQIHIRQDSALSPGLGTVEVLGRHPSERRRPWQRGQGVGVSLLAIAISPEEGDVLSQNNLPSELRYRCCSWECWNRSSGRAWPLSLGLFRNTAFGWLGRMEWSSCSRKGLLGENFSGIPLSRLTQQLSNLRVIAPGTPPSLLLSPGPYSVKWNQCNPRLSSRSE